MGRHFRVRNILVLELDSVADPFAARGFDMAIVRAVVLWGRGQVPSIDCVIRPCPSLVRLFVHLHLASHRG